MTEFTRRHGAMQGFLIPKTPTLQDYRPGGR